MLKVGELRRLLKHLDEELEVRIQIARDHEFCIRPLEADIVISTKTGIALLTTLDRGDTKT